VTQSDLEDVEKAKQPQEQELITDDLNDDELDQYVLTSNKKAGAVVKRIVKGVGLIQGAPEFEGCCAAGPPQMCPFIRV